MGAGSLERDGLWVREKKDEHRTSNGQHFVRVERAACHAAFFPSMNERVECVPSPLGERDRVRGAQSSSSEKPRVRMENRRLAVGEKRPFN